MQTCIVPAATESLGCFLALLSLYCRCLGWSNECGIDRPTDCLEPPPAVGLNPEWVSMSLLVIMMYKEHYAASINKH